MRACWCILSGTKACYNCPNSSIQENKKIVLNFPREPIDYKKKKTFYTWTTSSSNK